MTSSGGQARSARLSSRAWMGGVSAACVGGVCGRCVWAACVAACVSEC